MAIHQAKVSKGKFIPATNFSLNKGATATSFSKSLNGDVDKEIARKCTLQACSLSLRLISKCSSNKFKGVSKETNLYNMLSREAR